MIRGMELRDLAALTVHEPPVLSLYLDTDLSRQLKEQPKLVLRDLLEKARSEGARAEDVTRVTHFVDLEYDWRGRGLVVFSCQADGLWQPFPLPVPVKSQIYLGERLHLMPFSKILDQYAPYVVALVDQEGARLLLVDMGGIVRQENSAGEPIKRQKQGGWSASRFQRHENRMAFNNLKAAAQAMARFCAGNSCSRLILAGTEENIGRFRDLLSTPLRQAVLGTIPADMNAGPNEIVDRSREVLADVEKQRERIMVEEMITLSAKGGAAATGLDDTLFALQEGRVMTLLVEEGFSSPGYSCPGCNALASAQGDRCTFCGDSTAHAESDIVEPAAHKALLQGARVEVIANSPALAGAGHIGALLRY